MQYNKKKKVRWRLGVILSAGSIIGAVIGSLIFDQINSDWLVSFMLIFIILFACRNFYQVFIDKGTQKEKGHRFKPHQLIITAILSGLF